ncbi:GTP cyclohydrolase II [Silvanigrella paludirubra]|uniref:GTP cyclohydrolase II n=1 Tax=Silvanigrella paludirubra TaxID=2499159 RepID=A0A6N6VZ50_9BACT|nr:GTP cyclohydrolase II [Silvanigrella paludirubra]KAB8040512.1 GTP cyclohydrolase II [Silvanigrella paludirubra]
MTSNGHVLLTSHPASIFKHAAPLNWGEADPLLRGPVVASLTTREHRNSIGTHSGSYTVYRALANASGALTMEHKPDLTNTSPVINIGPFPSWEDPEKIVSLDPWGAKVGEVFKSFFEKGYDIRPTIAITTAHINMPEISQAIEAGRLHIDDKIISKNKDVLVTKAAIDPVWYLPGIAKRFNVSEGDLRRVLFDQTGGMFPELITRRDLKVLLPPIGSTSVYIFGDVKNVSDLSKKLTVRIHDECNGSDVFGSDICTCRPYLTHGIEESIRTAQEGGSGLIVYFRKEGRALGEVTKFLVYNARKRQEGGDSAATYFHRTECVAGVQDMRFQQLMPDVLHWLGIQRIDNLVSMSDMKYNAIVGSGIEVVRRVSIPDELIPPDAQVEMEAKKAAGYFTEGKTKSVSELKKVKGRKLDE